jgi:Uncharacterised nucleotidyltransferase
MSVSPPVSFPEQWSPELRLLISQLRLSLGTGTELELRLKDQPVDWDAWLMWVVRHRVGGLLRQRLPEAALARVPVSIRDELRLRGMASARQALVQVGELLRLTELLKSNGIRMLPFKGPVLSQQLYGDLGVRFSGDLDLLVAPADVAAADVILQEAGYERTYPDFELSSPQWRRFLTLQHELVYRCRKCGVVVELQWKLEGFPDSDFESLWLNRAALTVAGHSLATLPSEVSSLFLIAHGSRHGWPLLLWLVDAFLVLKKNEPDSGSQLWSTAQRMNLTKPLLQAVRLAEGVLGLTPLSALTGLGVSPWLLNEATRPMRLASAITGPAG